MIQKLPKEHPSTYKKLIERKFVVKTSACFLNAVAPDMKLGRSIQRSKKDAGGIINQTKQKVKGLKGN